MTLETKRFLMQKFEETDFERLFPAQNKSENYSL